MRNGFRYLLFVGSVSLAAGSVSASTELHTRVLYLQGMESREAVALLRSQVQVRQLASFSDRKIVVVAGTSKKVEESEALLREHDAVLRVAAPHEPVKLGPADGIPLVPSMFRVAEDKMKDVVLLLRSIYQVRDLSEFPQDNSISVRATQSVLDASEALLRELELLAVPVEEFRGSAPVGSTIDTEERQ